MYVFVRVCAECEQALLEGGADPEYGNPSAMQCVEMFNQEAWKAKFEGAPGRGKAGVSTPSGEGA